MAALVTVAPVLVMIAIGLFSRMRQLITPEQKEGANNLVLNLFFPVLIFSLLFQAQIDSSVLGLVLFLFAMYLVIMLLSATVLKKFFAPYDNIAPYLMVTVEGGNLAYPLFVSLAGAGASHTVLIDIAGMLLCFCVLPVLIAKAVATKSASGNKVSIRDIFISVIKNPFVIAAVSGIVLNLIGARGLMESTGWMELFTSVVNMITAPIVPILLFVVGYNMNSSPAVLKPAFKIAAARTVIYALLIVAIFLVFPGYLADELFMVAVLIYFTCPTGFGTVMQLGPLYRSEKEEGVASGVITLNMIVTLIVYVGVAIWRTM